MSTHPPGPLSNSSPLARQRRLDSSQEAAIRDRLAGIPHHHPPKATELLTIIDNRIQGPRSLVPTPRGRGPSRNSEEDLDIRIRRYGLGPIIPSGEIEIVLGGAVRGIGLETAVIVVELHKDGIHRNGAVEHGVVGGIGVGALGRSGQVVGA